MKNTIIILLLKFLYVQGAPHMSNGYLPTNTAVTDVYPTDTPSQPTEVVTAPQLAVLPQNDCGYTNVVFDNSLNTFNANDTIYFYDTNFPSNCGPQESDLGCVSQMHMTNLYSVLGFIPYTVWYYFNQVGSTTLVNLYFNYNNSAAFLVGTVPCDGVTDYKMTLSKCMFSEELYQYLFFDYYLFNFYVSCNLDKYDRVNFNINQESVTCVGGTNSQGNCNTNKNLFNLVNFKNWLMVTTEASNGAIEDFCPPPVPSYTSTSSYAPTATTTATAVVTTTSTTTTTSTSTSTSTTCKSCGGSGDGGIVINISNSNSNANNNNNNNNNDSTTKPKS